MITTNLNTTVNAWSNLSDNLFVPHTELVGEDESHPLASLMEVIGALIENYEDHYVPELSV